MGLLDSDNMEYFKNKVLGYSEDDYNVKGVGKDGLYIDSDTVGPGSTYPPVDRIYENHSARSDWNRSLSFWDMLKQGNIAGPFRRHFPLDKPDGYDKRWSKRYNQRENELLREYNDW
tara:strand:+ start:979 stop:1329 length:351 start_codon:yes stop_codon:yes gene_type:complete